MVAEGKGPRVLVIGLDGATMDIIAPMASRGELPNLSRLMAGGASGELASTIHPTTPQAWTTFMTGCSAGRHGVYDFIEVAPESLEVQFVNGSFKKKKSIWAILGGRNRKVGVVNVPFTYPPERVDGFMISGFDAPGVGSGFTYPEGLYEELVREVGRYDLRGTFPIGKKKSEYRAEDIDSVIRNRTDTCRHLMRTRPWDFFMVVYGSTDHVQHLFWKHMEEKDGGEEGEDTERFGHLIRHTYRKTDEAVGELIAEAGEGTTVIVMSDHGGGRLKRVVNLNNWLENNGFLSYGKRPFSKLAVDYAKGALKRRLPRSGRDWIKSRFPGLKGRAESMSYFAQIDWAGTKAYSWGMYGNISINLKGREARGIVAPEDYGALRAEIRERLLELEDPVEGGNVVEEALMREEVFDGPCAGKAPDILVRWRDYAYYTQGNLKRGDGAVFSERLSIEASDFEHTGTHRMNGTLIMSGPGIKKGAALAGASIMDVAPTVFYLMGLPVPAHMEGKVLTEAFTGGALAAKGPVRVVEEEGEDHPGLQMGYSGEDMAKVSEKLKGLGYF